VVQMRSSLFRDVLQHTAVNSPNVLPQLTGPSGTVTNCLELTTNQHYITSQKSEDLVPNPLIKLLISEIIGGNGDKEDRPNQCHRKQPPLLNSNHLMFTSVV
jgi:hypothetical protein